MDGYLEVDQSSASQATTDDQEIFDNINGRMHGPMIGFMEKHFGNLQYTGQGASAAPSPDNFLQWFSTYASRELDGARGLWHISQDSIASGHESTKGSARLLLAICPSPAYNYNHNIGTRWGHIQVIGQFYQHGCVCYQDGLLSLCWSAHQVFASQPTRLFLHGFYIRGSLIELWIFDRSGLYCSRVFNVQKDFNQFLSVILSYQQMTDEDLGKLDMIKTDIDGSYIMIHSAEMPSARKIYLESEPVASRQDLVGTGTTCYRVRMSESRRWSSILKFKWRWARERPENELLELAKKNCVWGAVSLDYYEELEKETSNFFQNRILTCTITSPAGRPLHTFQSLIELLQVFRDAVICHRSLYHDAKILHQDISSGNMIILDGQGEGKPKGILIDLDSAIQLTEGSKTEVDITGTRPSMAIGVLRGERHTYRHDLESFLYVFLWTVISSHAEKPPETSKLRRWSDGDWDELAVRKCLDMDQDSFRDILTEFTPEFYPLKSLAESLRQILFPLKDGVIWTGTHSSPEAVDKLYDGMMHAFEGAIASEGGR
ncbi:serine/threonine-protein kinase Sgk2 [Metarhizium rileyi]|uniref:Serine/threonine-protein kinase Sgk2 n=1 Tax=Metarhizium rileyi (strain RCEF 4871) TaxID=1649241 RepID=A0A162JLU9_METRR|nr:serine/threonine-protein kinase Sgk2 [Metarhizium rileyi RCEF 4871]